MSHGESFDAANAAHVALYDELSLWSSQAGALLLDHVPLEARTVLDLGCGAGFPLLELAERLGRGARVVGIDPWAQGLARTQAKRRMWGVPQASLVRGDGVRLPFRGSAFDLVTSNLGVNNFADPEGALRECRRVLAPGGALALATNVEGHFAEWYEAFEHVLRARADHAALDRLRLHVAHRGTADALASLLERCGLRVESTHTRTVAWRFANAGAVLDHHFMRLGFVPAWRDVAGEPADGVLEAVRVRLDADSGAAGEVLLSVPLVMMVARAG